MKTNIAEAVRKGKQIPKNKLTSGYRVCLVSEGRGRVSNTAIGFTKPFILH